MEVRFFKTGAEIKQAIQTRLAELQLRLDRRNETLNDFMKNSQKMRSYLVRSTQRNYGHGGGGNYMLPGRDDISSEEVEEIDQLCRRIYEIEMEMRRLALIAAHLDDAKQFELNYNELVSYGFTPEL